MEGAELDTLYSLTPRQLGTIDSMLGEIPDCHGFAGTQTAASQPRAQSLQPRESTK